jgi:predicted flap endonuclease-1-like 5' DNA nuclease
MNSRKPILKNGNKKGEYKMYSIDLTKFTLKEFGEVLHSIELLPGRRILLDNLDQTLPKLIGLNIVTLSDLQRILKKKSDYASLSKKISVSEDYLVVLNREINSYESKPLTLDKIEVLTGEEIQSLIDIGIKTTKDLYEKCSKAADRKTIIMKTKIDETKLSTALEITDLLRVNGIGPIYALILNEIGIKSINDYLNMNAEEILSKYQDLNEQKSYSRAKLGIKDIEYCKRFCRKLDKDIEW